MKQIYQKLTTLFKEDYNYSLDELRAITKSKTNYSLFNKLFLILITRIREIDVEESIDKYEDIFRSLDYASKIFASNSFVLEEHLKQDVELFKDVMRLKKSEAGIDDKWNNFISTVETRFYKMTSAYIKTPEIKQESLNKKKHKPDLNSSKFPSQSDNNDKSLPIEPSSKDKYYQYRPNLFNMFEGASYVNIKIITIADYVARLDITNECVITIDDNSSCRRLDDAISINCLADGTYMLGVHIADISNYLLQRERFGGDIFVDSINSALNNSGDIPIGIPEAIENEHSLFPNTPRTAISHFMKLDKQGELIDFGMYKTMIESKKRMDHNDAYKILNSYDGTDPVLKKKIYNLAKLATILESKYKHRFTSSASEQEKNIYDNQIISKQIVEAAISITGSNVAHYFKEQSLPIIYKRAAKGNPYTAIPTPHNELGFDAYCLISRPLARACDRLNQMIINDLCFSSKISDKMVYMWEDNVKKLVLTLNGNGQKKARVNLLNTFE
ncbi:MAG: RNB domain-containing ribonuclease [Bacilli bacterium]|nr:RNB domain-containing ribonuclease [Bacilli bacterium]